MKVTQRDMAERAAIRADAADPLMTATNAQIDTWVDANVGNLAEARTLFKKILKLQRNTLRRLALLRS